MFVLKIKAINAHMIVSGRLQSNHAKPRSKIRSIVIMKIATYIVGPIVYSRTINNKHNVDAKETSYRVLYHDKKSVFPTSSSCEFNQQTIRQQKRTKNKKTHDSNEMACSFFISLIKMNKHIADWLIEKPFI